MKKNYFLWAILLFATSSFAQKALILNGGKFGDPNEMANLLIYDSQSKQYNKFDTIYTASVQDLLIDGDEVYIAAQDSIIKYNLTLGKRVATAAFPGMSTKSLCLKNNELWVSNFYGQSSNNIYVFDQSNLNFKDSLTAVSRAVSSMVADQNYLYATQNTETSSYTDTLGIILKIDLTSKNIVDTLSFPSYTDGVGQLLIHKNNLIALNSTSNTIGEIDLNSSQATLNNIALDIAVGSRSNFSLYRDTAFIRTADDIAAFNLNDFSVIDSALLDTLVTAFSYDTVNHHFYITQTNFYSYRSGAIYNRLGQKLDTLQVGYSPEGLQIYYEQQVGLADEIKDKNQFKIYPNPAREQFQFELSDNSLTYEMQIFNQLGALHKAGEVKAGTIVNISNLEKGLYFVLLRSGTTKQVKRLIVH